VIKHSATGRLSSTFHCGIMLQETHYFEASACHARNNHSTTKESMSECLGRSLWHIRSCRFKLALIGHQEHKPPEQFPKTERVVESDLLDLVPILSRGHGDCLWGWMAAVETRDWARYIITFTCTHPSTSLLPVSWISQPRSRFRPCCFNESWSPGHNTLYCRGRIVGGSSSLAGSGITLDKTRIHENQEIETIH